MKPFEELEVLVDKVMADLKWITKEDLEYKASPKKWSKKEIIGHLIDSGQNNIQRFIRAQYEETPTIQYDQDQWVFHNTYQTFPTENLMELFKQTQLQIVHMWRHFSEDQAMKTCYFGKEKCTLRYILSDYLDHFKHHVKQLFDSSYDI